MRSPETYKSMAGFSLPPPPPPCPHTHNHITHKYIAIQSIDDKTRKQSQATGLSISVEICVSRWEMIMEALALYRMSHGQWGLKRECIFDFVYVFWLELQLKLKLPDMAFVVCFVVELR